MRVVGTLFFALAFHVASIVCPLNVKPEPSGVKSEPLDVELEILDEKPALPYRVVRMFKHDLPGVFTQYDTQVETPQKTYRMKEYHPVQRYLDVVIKDGNRIIGSANHERILEPIITYFDQGRGRKWTTMRYRPGFPADDPQILVGGEAAKLRMYLPLPANTIFERPLQRNAPPPRTIIHVDKKFNVMEITYENL